MGNVLRLFIAIEFSQAGVQRIGNIMRQLHVQKLPVIRWSNTESSHLTLKFLGDVHESQISSIVSAMHIARTGISPFALQLRDFGCFPNLTQPRILWIGIRGDLGPLFELQNRLDNAVEGLGVSKDLCKFFPHITIGKLRRHISFTELQHLGTIIKQVQNIEPISLQVDSLSLMQSQLNKNGATYIRKMKSRFMQ